jgi:hypothetical protein
MSTISRTTTGPLVGARNLIRREAATWWSTGRWRVHALAWTLILGGLLAAMLWVFPALMDEMQTATGGSQVRDLVRQFPDLAAVIIAVGVVLLTQGLLLDEQRNGVLEWLLSKPLTRPAVILAKFVGHALGLVATVVVLPWLVIHALLSIADGGLWSPTRGLAVVGLLALVVVFHLALVLLLSTLTQSRVAVLAIPIVAVVSADGVTGLVPEAVHVLPWSLGPIASVVLADGILLTGWPILATVAWTALLLLLAALRLQRVEL